MKERSQPQPTRVIKRDRRATLPQIAENLNAGSLTSVIVGIIQRNTIDMGFWSRRPTRVYPCRLNDTKFYASLGPVKTDII
ncbi:hypothetical protein TNCV_4657701 [Trichonephila clavipes]|nr:hypothetical protein TNCV_4657701 [Trichonephila clavipes]